MTELEASSRRTGYRLLPHVADVIVEAWAPDRPGCLDAAVKGLVATFADPGRAAPDGRVEFGFEAASDEEVLVRLLDEVIFLVDAHGLVPLTVTLFDADGAVRGWFATVPVDMVEETGAVPKGISRSGLEFGYDARARRWHCRVIVDV